VNTLHSWFALQFSIIKCVLSLALGNAHFSPHHTNTLIRPLLMNSSCTDGIVYWAVERGRAQPGQKNNNKLTWESKLIWIWNAIAEGFSFIYYFLRRSLGRKSYWKREKLSLLSFRQFRMEKQRDASGWQPRKSRASLRYKNHKLAINISGSGSESILFILTSKPLKYWKSHNDSRVIIKSIFNQ